MPYGSFMIENARREHDGVLTSQAVRILARVALTLMPLSVPMVLQAEPNGVVEPTVIQTLDTDTLRDYEPRSLADLSQQFAGLTAVIGPSQTPSWAAAGASINGLGANNNPVVATHWDGVELPINAYLMLPLMDIQTISFRPGSDGVQTGRGAVGGILNVEPVTADSRSANRFNVVVNNQHDALIDTAWNARLTDNINLRAAFWLNTAHNDQQIVSLNPNATGLNPETTLTPSQQQITQSPSSSTLSTRWSFVWQPIDLFKSTLVVDGTSQSNHSLAYQSLGMIDLTGHCVQMTASGCGQLLNTQSIVTPSGAHDGVGAFSEGDRDGAHAYGVVLKTSLSLPDEEIHTQTSWRYVNRYVAWAAGSLTSLGDQNNNTESNTFAQDFSVSSKGFNAVSPFAQSTQWRVGAHYGHDRVNEANDLIFDPNASAVSLSTGLGSWPDLKSLMIQSTDTLSVYAQAQSSWHDDWSVAGGVRDTHLHYTYNYNGSTLNAQAGIPLSSLGGTAYQSIPSLQQDQSQNAPTVDATLTHRTSFGSQYWRVSSGYTGSGLPGGVLVDQSAHPAFAGFISQSTPKSYTAATGLTWVSSHDLSGSLEAFFNALNNIDGSSVACPLSLAGVGACDYHALGAAHAVGIHVNAQSSDRYPFKTEWSATLTDARMVGGAFDGQTPLLTPKISLVDRMSYTVPGTVWGFKSTLKASVHFNSAMSDSWWAPSVDQIPPQTWVELRLVLKDPTLPLFWSVYVNNATQASDIWDRQGAGSLLLPDRQLWGPTREVGIKLNMGY